MTKESWDPGYVLGYFELSAEERARLSVEEQALEEAKKARRGDDMKKVEAAGQRLREALAASDEVSPSFVRPYEGTYVQVWDGAIVQQLEAGASGRISDRDELQRVKKACARLRAAGPWRRAVTVPDDWRTRVADLATGFPNFAAVTEYLGANCALAQRKDHVLRFGSFVLSGPPGIGKTRFVDAFAEAFLLPIHRIDMASAESGSRLSGSDEFWGNTKPGVLFEILAFGGHGGIANSLILLDELEKAGVQSQYDPTGGLYSLLEPMSAVSFTDHSFPDIKLDASHLLFVATCNDPHRIAEPIRSRMRHFDVQPPTPAQSRAIAIRIHDSIANELGLSALPLPSKILDSLMTSSPRRLHQALREGFGRALAAGRTNLEPSDIPMARASPPPDRPPTKVVLIAVDRNSNPDEDSSDPPKTLH